MGILVLVPIIPSPYIVFYLPLYLICFYSYKMMHPQYPMNTQHQPAAAPNNAQFSQGPPAAPAQFSHHPPAAAPNNAQFNNLHEVAQAAPYAGYAPQRQQMYAQPAPQGDGLCGCACCKPVPQGAGCC